MVDPSLRNGLVLDLDFTEGTGLRARDKSGYGNHGTLSGTTVTGPQWYRDETPNAVVIADDTQASFWGAYYNDGGGMNIPTLSNDTTIKMTGTDSLKIVITTSGSPTKYYVGVMHTYTVSAVWTGKEFITFWFYGANCSAVWRFTYLDTAATAGAYYEFTDNFTGWKKIIIPIAAMTAVGTPNLADIHFLYLNQRGPGDGVACTVYVDRVIVDVHNSGLYFDGVDDYVTVPNQVGVLDWTTPATISFREQFKLTSLTATCMPLSRTGDGYRFSINTSGNIYIEVFPTIGGVDTEVVLSWIGAGIVINTVYDLVVTFDGTNLKAYLNGKLGASTTCTIASALSNTANPWNIGRKTNATAYTNAIISSVQIWNRALSANEVQRLYESEKTPGFDLNSGLVLNLPMTEGVGLRTRDLSPYGNHGTLSGTTVTGPQWYRDETARALVIADDGQTAYWSNYSNGSGSYGITLSDETTIKSTGANSLKLVVGSGSSSAVGVTKSLGGNQDWSMYEFVSLYVYGANSGNTLDIVFYNAATTSSFHWTTTDNWTSWRKLVIPFSAFTTYTGTPSWTTIGTIYIRHYPIVAQCTFYIDRFTLDYHNSGLLFDGVDDVVKATDNAILQAMQVGNKVTVSCWINANGNPTGDWFIVNKNNWIQFWHFYGNLNFGLKFAGGSWAAALYLWAPTIGNWYHVVGTYDGVTMVLYVNGQSVNSLGVPLGPNVTYGDLGIGNLWSGGGTYPFNGTIKETHIWNRALSSQEIRELYNLGV